MSREEGWDEEENGVIDFFWCRLRQSACKIKMRCRRSFCLGNIAPAIYRRAIEMCFDFSSSSSSSSSALFRTLSVMYYFDLCGRPSRFSSGNRSLFFIKTVLFTAFLSPEKFFSFLLSITFVLRSKHFCGQVDCFEKSVTIVMEFVSDIL